MEYKGIIIDVRSMIGNLISSVESSEDNDGGGSMADSGVGLEVLEMV